MKHFNSNKHNVSISDKIAIVALLTNIVIALSLAYFGFRFNERISKLEYDELAPRIVMVRQSNVDEKHDYVSYYWTIRNNGRKATEDITITIYSSNEFLLEQCNLGVPHDDIVPRINNSESNRYFIFEELLLPPQGTISVFCISESGTSSNFALKYGLLPNEIPSLNCPSSNIYESDMVYKLPNLGLTGKNLEPSRVAYCLDDPSKLFE